MKQIKQQSFVQLTIAFQYTQKENVIYIVTCPGCNKDCVGKTDRDLATKSNENGSR